MAAMMALVALPMSAQLTETTTTYDFEDGNNPFTDDSRMTSAIESDANNESKVLVFTNAGNCQNGYGFAHFDFTSLVSKSVKTTVEFDYWNEGGARGMLSLGDALDRGNNGHSGKVTNSSTGAIFWAGSNRDYYFVPGWADITETDPETEEVTVTGTEFKQLSLRLTDYTNKWLHFKVVADVQAGTYSYVISDAEGTELLKAEEAPMNGYSLTQIDIFGWINNAKGVRIDNLAITSGEDASIKFADYTINWVFGETVLKTETRNGKVGDAISLIAADRDAQWTADKSMKYIFVDDNLEGLTITEEGTVVTLNYREASKWNWWLVAKAGRSTLATRFQEGEEFEGEIGYARYNKGFMYNGKAYTIEAGVNSNTYYQINITEDKAGATQIEYTAAGENVVYVGECEDLELTGSYNDPYGYARDRYAGGRACSLTTDSYVKLPVLDTEKGSVYTLTLSARVGGSGTTVPVYLVDTEGNLVSTEKAFSGMSVGPTPYTLTDLAVPAGYAIALKNDGESAGVELDFVIVERTGDIPVGINEIAAKANAEQNAIFNIAGQRVEKAVKGLYIVNGEKVVMK